MPWWWAERRKPGPGALPTAAGVTAPAQPTAWYLVEHHPVRVNLSIPLGIQDDRLIGPEIREGHLRTFRTHIQGVVHGVIVKVILTHVPNAIAWAECGWALRKAQATAAGHHSRRRGVLSSRPALPFLTPSKAATAPWAAPTPSSPLGPQPYHLSPSDWG